MIYDLTFKTVTGHEISLDQYRGKVLLIVNIASKCGFTFQLEELQALYEKYKDRGLEIIGFPCNQFALQTPETSQGFSEFCKLNYGVTFQLSEKIEVVGENAHPIFKYLTSTCSFEGFDMNDVQAKMLYAVIKEQMPENLYDDSIKWNFTKFLIDSNGNPVKRYESYVEPMEMVKDIEAII